MGTGSEQPLELAAGSESLLPVPGLGLPTLSQMESPNFIISSGFLSNGAGDGTEQGDVTCKSSCQAFFLDSTNLE